jgi:hypothetical protein
VKFFNFNRSQKNKVVSDDLLKVIDRYNTSAVLTTFDPIDPVILYSNKPHKKLMGYENSELFGKSPKIFQGELTSKDSTKNIRLELEVSNFWSGNIINYTKTKKQIEIVIVIFGIIYEGKKYFVALKKLKGDSST